MSTYEKMLRFTKLTEKIITYGDMATNLLNSIPPIAAGPSALNTAKVKNSGRAFKALHQRAGTMLGKLENLLQGWWLRDISAFASDFSTMKKSVKKP